VAAGTPEEIAANPASHTGRWLGPVLEARPAAVDAKATAQRELQVTV
jgi:excinuclease ABC subunit A